MLGFVKRYCWPERRCQEVPGSCLTAKSVRGTTAGTHNGSARHTYLVLQGLGLYAAYYGEIRSRLRRRASRQCQAQLSQPENGRIHRRRIDICCYSILYFR